MSADDVVNKLERFRNARTFPFYEDGVLREAAAEIGRLRGEVEAWSKSYDRAVELGQQHSGRAERMEVALLGFPEEPNPYTYRIAYAKAQDALRAADNRDAAGVDAVIEPLRGAAGRWNREADYHASGIADDYCSGQRHAFRSCALEMLAIIDQATPAAVPAGEAVAWVEVGQFCLGRPEEWELRSSQREAEDQPLYTTPPAPVQAAPQEADRD